MNVDKEVRGGACETVPGLEGLLRSLDGGKGGGVGTSVPPPTVAGKVPRVREGWVGKKEQTREP